MKRLVSPLALVLMLSTLSIGVRATPPMPPPTDEINMTLAGDRLFVSRGYRGLYVYNVGNPASPRKLAHIPLEFSGGTAVKGNVLFASDYNQLLVMYMTDNTYKVIARIGGTSYGGYNDNSGFSCACSSGDEFSPMAPSPDGGSSYASFAIVDDHLYRVDSSELVVYDISSPTQPKQVSRVSVGWKVQTIHPAQDLLFLGGALGMYIYDREDPAHPKQIARVEHMRACDPVVVSGSTAYVTVRGNGACGTADDELLCVSVEQPDAPVIIGEKPLATPWGLAVQDSRLYVSNGENGYMLLDVSNAVEPVLEKSWTERPTRDFIWSGNTLFVLQELNVLIFDVTDPTDPQLLSQVEPEPAL